MKRIMILLCSCLIALCSCKDEIEDCGSASKISFESQSSLGAYVQTSPAFLYNKFRHQKSIGSDFYRIQTDTQDTCVMCRWKKGSDDQMQLSVHTIGLEDVVKSGDYDAKIVKRVGRKYWLWADDVKLGFIIEIRD